MNYLELVQALHIEVGASGPVPNTVDGHTSETARLVQWVQRSDSLTKTQWINWKFLWATLGHSAVLPQDSPLLSIENVDTNLNVWDLGTFYTKDEPNGDLTPIESAEYEEVKHFGWVNSWKGRTNFNDYDRGSPSAVVILPDNRLLFNSIPEDTIYLVADYYKKPTKLEKNDDISEIPESFHDAVIIGQALIFYGNYRNAQELKTQGVERYQEGLLQLEGNQLPNKNYARTRAAGGFQIQSPADDEYG